MVNESKGPKTAGFHAPTLVHPYGDPIAAASPDETARMHKGSVRIGPPASYFAVSL